MVRPASRAGTSLLALCAFAALTALFFWPLWATKTGVPMTIGLPDGDFLRQFYPYRVFVARAWASGHVPAWNPHVYGGAPGWADPQYGVLYPWRLLQVPLALGGRTLPLWAVEIEALAHVAIGAWFTYLLSRRLGASEAGAALAGCVFGFGGYLTGFAVEQMAIVETAAWIPAALLGVTAAVDAAASERHGPARRWAVGAGAATALSAYAGHPQTAVYGAYLTAAWLGTRLWFRHVPWRRAGAVAAGWGLFAVGLSAAQWLPTADLSRRAPRSLPWSEIAAGLRPADLLQALAPPASPQPGPGGGPDAIVWAPMFVGGLALALLAWGVVRVPGTRFWAGAAAVAALMSLGGANPLLPLLVRIVPGLGLFRHQERFAVLFGLCVAVAAGLALDRAVAERPAGRESGRWLVLAGGSAAFVAALLVVGPWDARTASADGFAMAALTLLAAGALLLAGGAGRLSRRAVVLGVLAIAAGELFSAGSGRALAPDTGAWTPDALVEALQSRSREGRVASEGLLPGGPNAAMVYGLYDVTGDHVLVPSSVGRLDAMPELVRWRLMGVRYVVSDRDFPEDAPVAEIARTGRDVLYEVLLPSPPTWVPNAIEVLTPAELADWDPAPDHDPLALAPVAALDDAGQLRLLDYAPSQPDASRRRDDQVQLGALDPGRAAVAARLGAPGLLVLSTAYDRGWRTDVPDGTETLAYGVLPAVLLDAGEWTVGWTYRPLALPLGMVLSGATLLLGVRSWRRSRETLP